MAPDRDGPVARDGSPYPDRARPTFEREVRAMFASIADRYDAFNHLATFGLDLVWRPRALWELDRYRHLPVRRALDVGCGTGGLARRLADRYPRAEVVAVDFSRAMVAAARGRGTPPALGVANASRLPFADGTFDLVASAFVARNFADLRGTARELGRVLRPGGSLLTLEVSEPASPTVRRLFHAHFDGVVPMIGRAFGREGPYRYLPESLRRFPSVREVVTILDAAGFVRVVARPISVGIVTAYLAEAPARGQRG